jgi:hypothetical protein
MGPNGDVACLRACDFGITFESGGGGGAIPGKQGKGGVGLVAEAVGLGLLQGNGGRTTGQPLPPITCGALTVWSVPRTLVANLADAHAAIQKAEAGARSSWGRSERLAPSSSAAAGDGNGLDWRQQEQPTGSSSSSSSSRGGLVGFGATAFWAGVFAATAAKDLEEKQRRAEARMRRDDPSIKEAEEVLALT